MAQRAVMIEWQAAYSVGNAVLDAQHRKLLLLCQTAAACLESDRRGATERLRDVLNDMAIYAREHFRTEEQILMEAGYPLLEFHKAEHLAYEARLGELLAEAAAGHVEGSAIAIYLAQWWHEHILCSDKQYEQFMRTPRQRVDERGR